MATYGNSFMGNYMRGQQMYQNEQVVRNRQQAIEAELSRKEQERQQEMKNRNSLAEIYTRTMGPDAGDVIRYGGTAANANSLHEMMNPNVGQDESMFGKLIYKKNPDTGKTHAWQLSKGGSILDLGEINVTCMVPDRGGAPGSRGPVPRASAASSSLMNPRDSCSNILDCIMILNASSSLAGRRSISLNSHFT